MKVEMARWVVKISKKRYRGMATMGTNLRHAFVYTRRASATRIMKTDQVVKVRVTIEEI
jgi:hypothetical protein